MADLARKFPDRQFVVTGVSWLDRSIYEQYIADSGIRYVCDQTYETLAAAEAGRRDLRHGDARNGPAECTGSGSLSHALVPGEIAALRAESSLRVAGEPQPGPRIGRGDHPVRPGHHTAERELRAILTGGEKRERMLRDFAELQAVIGAPGASDRFAARMVELLKKQVR